jgi:serine/threonine protein kinase
MIGEIINDKYRVFDHIDEDPLTTSYLARDRSQNEIVVLRLIRPEMAPGEEFLERFRSEAEKLKRLISSQAVKALDHNRAETGAYVIFEYVGEKTLASLCQTQGALPLEQALDIGRQLGLCLVDAHARDLIHRDLRPTNIVIASDGAIKVTNFGVAWGVDLGRLLAEARLEPDAYHSPEQAAGLEVDIRADLYSLGAVLFEILTGEIPCLAEDLPDGGRRPSRLQAELPPEVDDLVARCLAPEPRDRPQSAAEFLEGINEALRAKAMSTERPTLSMEDALTGHTLGAYRLVEKLGRGGMATVYKGYEPALDRYVAIKVLPQHMAGDPEFLSRFRREAKAIARLNHPNIVPVFGFGEEGDLTFIAMRYVEGGTLKDLMGQPMTTDQALKLVLRVARALSYAHDQGVIHRDVKPANVLMAEGDWPLLSDFGLARMMGSSMQLTQTGVGLGTPAYMSPEQGQGLQVDGRSDIYSLGIMLYEMLTGQVPFQADTPMAIVLRHITAPLPMPRQVNPDIPESAERVILRATAKDPAQRYQAAEDMIEALDRALAGMPVEAPPLPIPPASMTAAFAQPQDSAATLSEAAPPSVPAAPSTATDRPPTARRFLFGLLRTVGILLALLVVVILTLLVLGSFAISSVIEKSVANANWGEAYPGSQVKFTESQIEHMVSEGIRLYLPGSVEDVNLDFAPPDTINIQGEVFGRHMSADCTLTEADSEIDFQLTRLGDARPFLLGGILSGGVNRGLKTLLEAQSLNVEELKVDANSLTIQYAD